MTKDEELHLSRVAGLGCIVCRHEYGQRSPAEIHHIRTGQGKSQRASNFEVIPLCPNHHRLGGHGIAFHAGQKTWEAKFGTELELFKQVRRLLEEAGLLPKEPEKGEEA